MFATSWLLTLFTRVLEFSLVYELIEIFLFERDRYLIFYLSIAIMKIFRSKIMAMNKFETLLKFFSVELKLKDFG